MADKLTCYDCLHCDVCSGIGSCSFHCSDVDKCKFFEDKNCYIAVRCKDCRFRTTRRCSFTGYNQYGDLVDFTEDDGYCSDGEQK